MTGCVDYSSVNDTLIDIKTSLNSAVEKNKELAKNHKASKTQVPAAVDDLLFKTNSVKNNRNMCQNP